MHDNRFVHRDLKPGARCFTINHYSIHVPITNVLAVQNIMVVRRSPDWYLKIADFGISKRRQDDVTTLHTMNQGTFGFTAPEVLGLLLQAKESYTFAVDLWSLRVGTVIFMMLNLSPPFRTLPELCKYTMGGTFMNFPIEPLQARGITLERQAFVKWLMRVDPQERPSAKGAARLSWMTMSTISFPNFASQSKPDNNPVSSSSSPHTTATSVPSAAWSTGDEDRQPVQTQDCHCTTRR